MLILLMSACAPAATPTPTPPVAERTPTPLVERPFGIVTFTTSDGTRLGGRTFGQGEAGVILAHMFPADQESWREFAQLLAQRGYMALTFDFRGYPGSEGSKEIDRLDRDVEAALAFTRGQGVDRVFLVGASMGGTASLKVAARQPVAGVVSLSAPQAFRGLEVSEAELSGLRSPVLFLASQGDAAAAQAAQSMHRRAPEPKELRLLPGSAHGTNMLQGAQGKEVEGLILSFLERYGR